MLTTNKPENGRGCGSRDKGMPYACCGLSKDGMPVENFVIDPASPWPGAFQRGSKILPRSHKDIDGIQDLIIFVGKEHYPSPWSFVEEVRRYGASRKISPSLPLDKLTPYESRMVFVHSRAIPLFDYRLNRGEPGDRPLAGCTFWREYEKDSSGDLLPGYHPKSNYYQNSRCTFALRDLAFLVEKDIESVLSDPAFYQVHLPSFSYEAKYPLVPKSYLPTEWGIGLFLALPLTTIEFCQQADPAVKEQAEQAGFDVAVLDY